VPRLLTPGIIHFYEGCYTLTKQTRFFLDHKGNEIVKGMVDFAFNVDANGDVSTEYTANSDK
jgi:hypothetical protein